MLKFDEYIKSTNLIHENKSPQIGVGKKVFTSKYVPLQTYYDSILDQTEKAEVEDILYRNPELKEFDLVVSEPSKYRFLVFDNIGDPHPHVSQSLIYNKETEEISAGKTNGQIYHRMEQMIPVDHELQPFYQKLTEYEESLGLLGRPNIGHQKIWDNLIKSTVKGGIKEYNRMVEEIRLNSYKPTLVQQFSKELKRKEIMQKDGYIPGITAIKSRRGQSSVLSIALKYIKEDDRVLHAGAGAKNNPDRNVLDSLAKDVVHYDPQHEDESDKDSIRNADFDVVISPFVLNVLDHYDRQEPIADMVLSLKPTGIAIVGVRGRGDIGIESKKGWDKYSDGWLTSKGNKVIFQKGFSPTELQNTLSEYFDSVKIIRNSGKASVVLCVGPKYDSVDPNITAKFGRIEESFAFRDRFLEEIDNKVTDNTDIYSRHKESTKPSFKEYISESVTNELVWLKQYLNMSVEDKQLDMAHSIPYYIDEFMSETYPDMDEGGYENYEDYERVENLSDEIKREYGEWVINNKYHDAEMPSYLFFDADSKIIRNAWLLHFTDSANDVYNQGFTRGVDDMSKLALTTWLSERDKENGGYGFAYDTDYGWENKAHADRGGGWKYGQGIIMFQGSGVETYHTGDQEEQVIFYGKYAKNLIYINNNSGYGDDYSVDSVITGRTLYRSEELTHVVEWVKRNFDTYRKHLVSRLKLQ